MKKRFGLPLGVIIGVAICFFIWLRNAGPRSPFLQRTVAQRNTAVRRASAQQNAQQVGVIQSSFVPARARAARPSPGAVSIVIPPAGPPSPLQITNIEPATVLQNISRAIGRYGEMFGGNPVGNNQEITSELAGKNPKRINFISADAGMRINEAGELVDPWGTPYFFHQLSGADTEIHSAGPDRILWTSDDIVVHSRQ